MDAVLCEIDPEGSNLTQSRLQGRYENVAALVASLACPSTFANADPLHVADEALLLL